MMHLYDESPRGAYRVECELDGLHVIGHGQDWPIQSRAIGRRLIRILNIRRHRSCCHSRTQ